MHKRSRAPAAASLIATALVLTACSGNVGAGDGGQNDGGGVVTCIDDSQCPPALPVCSGGVCTEGGNVCSSDVDCPGGTCNQLTGRCEACADCCVDDNDCSGDDVCVGGRCETPGGPCSIADDCEPGQICSAGTCSPFDPDEPCTTDADCPRDHSCNALGDARCEGCLNDAYCLNSPHGPKCDLTDDGSGPGPGYCYPECGVGIGDCPADFFCDTDRGGLCVPACANNSDCSSGLVCKGGKCEACTADAQCDPGKICSDNGTCIDQPVCSDVECQNSLGAAYFCDTATNSCRLGCTASGCSGPVAECNPCPSPQTCDPGTHQCSGGAGCTACPTDCSLTGQICDTVTCQCVGTGGGGGPGDPCLSDNDCSGSLSCIGALPQFGLPGACGQSCGADTLCICESGQVCYILGEPVLDILVCILGVDGVCQ